MAQCYKCQTSLNEDMHFGRQDTCPHCSFDTRVCLNCIHYDLSKYNECTEPVADRVVDKEKSNFCDYFKPGKLNATNNSAIDALKAAEALFKKLK